MLVPLVAWISEVVSARFNIFQLIFTLQLAISGTNDEAKGLTSNIAPLL